jgi:photosystem II stability/assembly factor-like uncharacterized protein
MQTRKLKNWEDFEKKLVELFKMREEMQKKSEKYVYVSVLLFRGQTESEWKLKTTLERNSDGPMDMLEYYSIIHDIKSEI